LNDVQAPELNGWTATHGWDEARLRASGLPLPTGLSRPAALVDHPALTPSWR
jgi:hypothetical protein